MGHGAPAFARFAAAGLAPSLSVDVETSASGDMFGQMRSAFQLGRMEGHQLAARGIESRLPTTRDVLAWATIAGARACGLESIAGTIEVGKRGDIAVIDLQQPGTVPVNNPVGALVLNAGPDHVTNVLVDGLVVKRNGVLVSTDLRQAMNKAETARDRLWSARAAATKGGG